MARLLRASMAPWVSFATGLLLSAAMPVAAQLQTPQQRGCIVAVNKAALRLAKAQVREVSACSARLVAAGGHPTACLTSDPEGKVQAARVRLSAAAGKKCSAAPDFGNAAPTAVMSAAAAEAVATIAQLHGASGFPGPESAADATCLSQTDRQFEKLFLAKLKAFVVCKQKGLADGSITSAAALASCVAETKATKNPKIGSLVAKLGDIAGKLCPLGGGLWSCFDTDPALFSQCVDRFVDCRACSHFRTADSLALDCDALDDGAVNDSCPDACGNGVTGVGRFGIVEACDDGNLASGDGCDYDCSVSGCGNDIPAGTEYCDGFAGRCVGGTDDGSPCGENAECSTGSCTSCPSGECAADCGSCGPGVCCTGAIGCVLYPGFGQSCLALPGGAPCDSDTCQFAGTCCSIASGCTDDPFYVAECTNLPGGGGALIPCSQCPSCCAFDGYCTSWSAADCLEYEGTPVDCSQCWPDTP